MKLFGVPISANISFFLVIGFLGFGRLSEPLSLVIWLVVATFSVLVHEFGHAGVGRLFGLQPSILLHGMGGLTTWRNPDVPLSPWKDIAITLAGPGAGFVLGTLVLIVSVATGMIGQDESLIGVALSDLLWVNFGWGVINLIPMLPLDGGRVMKAVLSLIAPRHAVKGAHLVSIVVAVLAAGLAIWAGTIWGVFLAAWMGWMNLSGLTAASSSPDAAPDVPANAGDPAVQQAAALATAALQRQDLEGAIEHLRVIAEHGQPAQRAAAFESLAVCHVRLGNFPEASRMLDNLPRDHAVSPHILGLIALRTGHPEDAVVPLARALSERHDPNIAALLAEAYAQQRQPERAWRLLDTLQATMDPMDHAILEQTIAFHTGELDRAISVGERTFETHNNPNVAYNVACTHARLGNLDDAIRWLDRAIDAGFQPLETILRDPDLAPLRTRPEFGAWYAKRA